MISGSITGALDGAATPFTFITVTSGTITLNSDDDNSIAFPAIIQNAALTTSQEGTSDVTYNFELQSTTTAISFSLTNYATATWTD